MQKVNFKNRNGQRVSMAANIYFPADFNEANTYPAVVVESGIHTCLDYKKPLFAATFLVHYDWAAAKISGC